MRTTDIFGHNKAQKINESLEKTFGKKLALETFTVAQLEDARNRLRTQVSQVRDGSGFNETIENEALTQAQWMLDSINAELAERFEQTAIHPAEVDEAPVDEGSAHGYNVVKWYEKHGDQLKLTRWLEKEAGLSKDSDLYFDDDDLVWIDKTILPHALSNPKFKFNDLLTAVVRATGSGQEQEYVHGSYRKVPQPGSSGDPHRDTRGTESISIESAPPTAKGERMVKHIKQGYAKDGKLTDKEKSIAYATAWKQHNKESIESGEDMNQVRESAADKAGAVVVAKDMTDKVGRWIEELSGMENDTLLNLGDTIRDEMGQEQAKAYLEVVAPAIQQALAGLKSTRETLAGGMRSLTGEEQSAEVIGAEPTGEEPGMDVAAPDELNAGEELPPEPGAEEDAFAASEPATGGLEAAGREQRESIQFQNRLLSVLAG